VNLDYIITLVFYLYHSETYIYKDKEIVKEGYKVVFCELLNFTMCIGDRIEIYEVIFFLW